MGREGAIPRRQFELNIHPKILIIIYGLGRASKISVMLIIHNESYDFFFGPIIEVQRVAVVAERGGR